MTLNQYLFLLINHIAEKNYWLDVSMIAIAEYTPYFFLLILIFYWFYKRGKFQDTVLYAGYSAVLGLFVNRIISLAYGHNRPFVDGLGKNLVPHIPDSSFPSDHTTFVLCIAITFFLFQKTRVLGFFLFFIGFVSGIARVFVGVHYPFDVFGSLAVALLSAVIIFLYRKMLMPINRIMIAINRKMFGNRKD